MSSSKVIQIPFVDLGADFAKNESEYLEVFQKIGRSGQYILGENVIDFEKNIGLLLNTKHVISVGNGSDAIVFILKALGIGPGDEVITAPNSFIASAWSIVSVGAVPVFCDIDESLNLDPVELSKHITKRTKAILAVHLAGVPSKIDIIENICKQNKIYLIEDCAQSIGSLYKSRSTGTFGIAGAFSLHPLKNLGGLGDGGFITTDNAELANSLTLLRNHGLSNRDSAETWGYNSRLDELQAAFLNIRLQNFHKNKKRVQDIASYFIQNLTSEIETPKIDSDMDVFWHRFILFTNSRDYIREELMNKGIDTRIHYPIPIHLQNCSKNLGYTIGDFPKTERQSYESFSLPLYALLSDPQVEYIVQCLNTIVKKAL